MGLRQGEGSGLPVVHDYPVGLTGFKRRSDGLDGVEFHQLLLAGNCPGRGRRLHERNPHDDVIAVQLQRLITGADAALYGGLVVAHPQQMFWLVGYQVRPRYSDWNLDPCPPVAAACLIGRRLHQRQEHIHFVRIATGDHLVRRIVDERKVGVGFDDSRLNCIGIPGVDIFAAISNLELDRNLPGASDGLASDKRSRAVGVGYVPQLDYQGCVWTEGQPFPVGDGAAYRCVGVPPRRRFPCRRCFPCRWRFPRRVGRIGLALTCRGSQQHDPDAHNGKQCGFG